MLLTFARCLVFAALVAGLPAVAEAQGPPRVAAGALPAADRPFGTLREQATMQQAWLKKRLDTFAARRRTIYVFFDKCAAAGTAPAPECVERIALGGTSQGGLFDARTSAKTVANPVNGRQAELWGDEQWLLLKQVVEERKPKVIGIDRSTTFA